MTTSLWNETRKHTVKVGPHACEITLRHIGDASDVFKFKRMQAAWERTRESARKDARLKLLAEYGDADAAMAGVLGNVEAPTFEWAIAVWMQQQESWMDALTARVQGLIEAGTAEGTAAIKLLFEHGGEAMLLKAADDILKFHVVDPAQGEG